MTQGVEEPKTQPLVEPCAGDHVPKPQELGARLKCTEYLGGMHHRIDEIPFLTVRHEVLLARFAEHNMTRRPKQIGGHRHLK